MDISFKVRDSLQHMSSSATRLSWERVPKLTSENFACCHTETEREDRDFSLSQLHYTDTDLISREQAPATEIKPTTSSPRVLHTKLPHEL